jgi:threonylcarbamoyladenosine tRNA methylthiotransferase MtaB
MKVGFYTLGCKVNQAEVEALKWEFQELGFEVACKEEEADIYIVNSCTVTATSDHKTRQFINRAKRKGKFVVLTGCFVSSFKEQVAALGVDFAVPNKEKMALPKLLLNYFKEQVQPVKQIDTLYVSNRMRAFVKIQDGCNRSCSYCIIPTARGPSCSRLPDDIKAELLRLTARGFKEVVFVGINLLLYGLDIGCELVDVVEMACGIPLLKRVRLSSIEPEGLDIEVLNRLLKQEKFCPHFHISLQSGSDRVLKRMGRCYTAKEYADSLKKIREKFVNPAITTDVIVGFPGETEDEFSESLEFVKNMRFSKVHIFPYSRRPGTKAAAMQTQVPDVVKKQRCKRLREIDRINRLAFNKNMIGKKEQVLFESAKDGSFRGYTSNYVSVSVETNDDLNNKLVEVNIFDADENGCFGSV